MQNETRINVELYNTNNKIAELNFKYDIKAITREDYSAEMDQLEVKREVLLWVLEGDE